MEWSQIHRSVFETGRGHMGEYSRGARGPTGEMSASRETSASNAALASSRWSSVAVGHPCGRTCVERLRADGAGRMRRGRGEIVARGAAGLEKSSLRNKCCQGRDSRVRDSSARFACRRLPVRCHRIARIVAPGGQARPGDFARDCADGRRRCRDRIDRQRAADGSRGADRGTGCEELERRPHRAGQARPTVSIACFLGSLAETLVRIATVPIPLVRAK